MQGPSTGIQSISWFAERIVTDGQTSFGTMTAINRRRYRAPRAAVATAGLMLVGSFSANRTQAMFTGGRQDLVE